MEDVEFLTLRLTADIGDEAKPGGTKRVEFAFCVPAAVLKQQAINPGMPEMFIRAKAVNPWLAELEKEIAKAVKDACKNNF